MRHIRRILVWALLILCLPIILAVGGALSFVYFAGEDTWSAALRQATKAASTPDQTITTNGFRRDEAGLLRLARLSLADSGGDWLVVEDVAVDLHASRLLDGTLHLEAVTARSVAVLREPAAEVKPAEPPQPIVFPDRITVPELPISLDLKHVSIGEILIAEGLAPEQIRLTATGNAIATRERFAVSLNVQPLEVDDSHLIADLSIDPDTGTLKADIDASLPTMEPLRSALTAPEDSRISLTVKGGGPLSGARLDLGLSVDGVLDLIGDLKIATTQQKGLKIELEGFTNLLGGAAAQPAELIGAAVEFQVVAAMPAPDQLILETLLLDAQYLRVLGDGMVNLDDEQVSLTTRATFRNHAGLSVLLQGASFDTADLNLSVSGSFDVPVAHADLTLVAPGFDDFGARALRLDTRATRRGEGISGTLALVVTDPTATDPAIPDVLGPSVIAETQFEASPARVQLSQIQLTTALARMTGDLSLDPATAAMTGNLTLTADDLTLARQVSAFLNDGSATVAIRLDQIGAEKGEATVEARLKNLAFADPALQSLSGDAISINGKAILSGPDITSTLSAAAGGGLTTDVTATLSGQAINADYRLALPRIPGTLLPPAIDGLGNIILTGTLSGMTDNPIVQGRLTTSDLTLNGAAITSPVMAFTASNLTSAPDADIELSARVLNAPLRFVSRVNADQQANLLRLDQAELDWKSIRMSATGTMNLATTLADMDATFSADDLSVLSELAGQRLAGNLNVDLKTASTNGQMNVRLAATASAIQTDAASVENLKLSLEVQNALAPAPSLDGTVEARNIAAGDAAIPTASVRVSGDIEKPKADIKVHASAPVRADLATTVQANLSDPAAIRATFETLSLAAQQGTITARQPFTITAAGDSVELSELDLTSSIGGRVSGNAIYGPSRIAAALDIADLEVGAIAAIAGMEGFTGEANATVRVDTGHVTNKAAFSLTVNGVTVPDVPTDTPFALEINAGWRGHTATAEAEITGPFDTPLVAQFSGELPSSTGQPLPVPQPNGPISGSLAWRGDLSRVLALLPESDHLADGGATVDISLGGTWSEPGMKGDIAITDARYENLLSGTQLNNIGLDVTFDDAGAGAFRLSARGPERGTITGEGELVLIGPEKGVDIQIAVRNLLAVRRDEVRAIVGGDTRLAWDGKRVNVHVRKVLERVDVFLATPNLPPSVVTIDLERDRSRAAEQEAKDAPDLPIDLDIQVSSLGQFFVRGRGLESEWRGDLVITGAASDPVIRSRFEAVRGNLALLGRDFRLDKGELGLDESFKPDFRIELLRDTPDLTGRIIVSGSPAKPDISFSSEPELPPDEVLPRVLFDKAKQSLSPLEAVNLAQGIRTLSNGKPGTTDQIREAVGLDVLRFEEGESEESAGAVSVGRYVRDGVYVGAKKSVDSEAGSVVVEIDILPNLKVDAEVGQGGGGSTGITWEKKY